MADTTATDLLVKIGGDASDLNLTLGGVFDNIKDYIAEIDPVVGAAVAAVGGIAVAAIDSAVQFEDAYNDIIAKTGATGEALDGLKQSFNDVFTAVPGDMKQTADAISLLHDRLQLTGDDLTTLATQVAQLSQYSGQAAGTIADSVTKAFQNWDVATEDQTSKLDLLNSLSQQTGVSVTQLAQSMSDVGNLARLSGESFDEVAQQIAVLQQNGVGAQDIFQGISRAMSQAQKSGVDLGDVTLPNLIYSIQQGIQAGTGLADAIDLFGTRSGPKMYQLIADNKITLDSFNQSLSDSTDSINKTYQATDSFSRELSTLKDNLMAILQPIGDLFNSAGTQLLKWLNDGAVGLREFGDVLSGDTDGFNTLVDAQAKASSSTQDVVTHTQTLDATTQAAISSLGGLKIVIDGVDVSTNSAAQAHINLIAAEQAAKENAELLKASTSLLDEAEKQNAADIKALTIPALMDVGTAQANLNIYRTEAAQTDQILVSAESALQALVQSGSKDNAALALAESNVALAKQAAVSANQNLSDAEKDLATSKTADQQITSLLKSSQDGLYGAMQSLYIPTVETMATAEADVQTAQQNLSTAIQAEQDARQALSDFQNQVGIKDAATEKQLELDLTDATKSVTDAKNQLTDAEKNLNLSRQTANQLAQDQLQAETTLDTFYRSQGLNTFADLDTAIQKLNADKTAATAAAQAYQQAIQNEETVLTTEGATQQQVTDATNATKQAKDALKQSTADLTNDESAATAQFGLSKQALDVLTASTSGAAVSAQTLANAYQDLGVKSSVSLQNLATAADQSFQDIKNSGTASAGDLLNAQIADLQAQVTAQTAAGQGVSAAQQLTLAQLKQQQADYVADNTQQWSTMYNSIDKSVQDFSASAIQTLVTGTGSFGQEAMKMLENIGAAVLTAFIKPATDAIAGFIAGAVKDLFTNFDNIGSQLDTLGTKMASVFSGTGSAASSATSSASSATSGAGSAASGAGSAASSVSSLAGTVTAISSAVSAITGVLNLLGVGNSGDQLDRLNIIANKTSGMEEALYDDGGSAIFYTSANTSNQMSNLNSSMAGWVHDWASSSMDFNENVHNDIYSIKAYVMLLGDIHDSIVQVPGMLTSLATAIQPPVVNVAVTLDGQSIASQVQTTIEQNLQLAGVSS